MDLKTRITGINAFLSEIYADSDMRMSRFLAGIGIGEDDIEAIRRNHMEEFAAGCIALLSQEPFKHDERSFRAHIVAHGDGRGDAENTTGER